MKFGAVNKSTTVNRFVLHSLQRNITHLAVIKRKTTIKLGILKGGKLEKSLFWCKEGFYKVMFENQTAFYKTCRFVQQPDNVNKKVFAGGGKEKVSKNYSTVILRLSGGLQ